MEQEARIWAKHIIKEYREYCNPAVSAAIDVVWVLSGYGVYNRQSVAFPNLWQVPALPESLFLVDDRERIDLATNLIYEITARRIGKEVADVSKQDVEQHGPQFFYNGTAHQNRILREAVSDNNFPLPENKVLISEISPELDRTRVNTKTQALDFSQKLLGEIVKKGGVIALVTHCFHLSRVKRTLSAPDVVAACPEWEKANVLFFVADRPVRRDEAKSVMRRALDIRQAVRNEAERIGPYIRRGWLADQPRGK